MIVTDDFSRYVWLYFILALLRRSNHLADIRVEGIPSDVVVVRFDNGGEFTEGELCRGRPLYKRSQLQAAQRTVGWPSEN